MSGAQQVSRPVPRWLKILLAISLGLNLAVIGLVLGLAIRFGGGPPPRANIDFALPYARALPPQDRREIMRQVRRSSAVDGMTGESREARYAAIVAALRSQPFDADVLNALASEQAQMGWTLHRAAQEAWIAHVARMEPEARAAYADAVEERALRRGSGRK